MSHAGLVPVMALAQRVGLGQLAAEFVHPGGECGAHLKAPCLVDGMAAGADSFDDRGGPVAPAGNGGDCAAAVLAAPLSILGRHPAFRLLLIALIG